MEVKVNEEHLEHLVQHTGVILHRLQIKPEILQQTAIINKKGHSQQTCLPCHLRRIPNDIQVTSHLPQRAASVISLAIQAATTQSS